MRDWSPRRTWKWAWWCAGGTRCTSRAVGGPSVASVSFARHQAGRHLHIVAERGGGGCSHARQPALMLRGGSGTHRGRGGLRRVQRGWDGPGGPVRAWTAGSWNTWRALARGETLRRVRRVEREMLSWLLVYYLFCIGGAAIGSPRHPLLT